MTPIPQKGMDEFLRTATYTVGRDCLFPVGVLWVAGKKTENLKREATLLPSSRAKGKEFLESWGATVHMPQRRRMKATNPSDPERVTSRLVRAGLAIGGTKGAMPAATRQTTNSPGP
jgi:hypothetical protein